MNHLKYSKEFSESLISSIKNKYKNLTEVGNDEKEGKEILNGIDTLEIGDIHSKRDHLSTGKMTHHNQLRFDFVLNGENIVVIRNTKSVVKISGWGPIDSDSTHSYLLYKPDTQPVTGRKYLDVSQRLCKKIFTKILSKR